MGNRKRARARELPPTSEERELAGKLWGWMARWQGDLDELAAKGVAHTNPDFTWGLTTEGRQLLNRVMPEPYAMWDRVRQLRDECHPTDSRRLLSMTVLWEADDNG